MILYGASGHGKVVADAIADEVDLFFYDDAPTSLGNLIELNPQTIREHLFIITIGNNWIRKKIVNSHAFGYGMAVHQRSFVSQSAQIGVGTVVLANASVNAGAIVGNHCIINTNAVVEHDCIVADFVHISPNASISGNVTIGEGSHLGIGSCVIPGIKIGKWVTIGAGAVIIKDVPDYAVVVGNPGKIIKYHS